MLRMLTGQTSSRYILAAIALFLIIAITFQHDRLPARLRLPRPSFSTLKCADDVRSSIKVASPWGVDPARMTALWKTLEADFKEAKPLPEYLEKPAGNPDGSDPDIPTMREQVLISEADGAKTRDMHAKLVAKLPDYPTDLYVGGKGVVTLAGGRYSEFAATSLGMLREMGSTLPVEIWVVDESEEVAGWCVELAAEGMACRRLTDYVDTSNFDSAYQYKVFTIFFSVFDEVIFIDADSIPLQNLDELFLADAYVSTGAVLWPDYWESIASPHTPYLVGVSDAWRDHRWYNEGTVESGQLMWDKRRHWKSLLLAVYYNYHGPNYYYTLLSANFAGWGDKDTFPLGLRAAGESFHAIKHGIATAFMTPNGKIDMFHGIGMVQADPRNLTHHNALFLHCNIIKWSMRAFVCDGCYDIWSTERGADGKPPKYSSRFDNPDDDLYENLHTHVRVFNKAAFDRDGLDPEPMLWKTLEHTACRSTAWGSPELCGRVRRYMHTAFGFRFAEPTWDQTMLAAEELDVLAKAERPELCIVHPKDWSYFNATVRGW